MFMLSAVDPRGERPSGWKYGNPLFSFLPPFCRDPVNPVERKNKLTFYATSKTDIFSLAKWNLSTKIRFFQRIRHFGKLLEALRIPFSDGKLPNRKWPFTQNKFAHRNGLFRRYFTGSTGWFVCVVSTLKGDVSLLNFKQGCRVVGRSLGFESINEFRKDR